MKESVRSLIQGDKVIWAIFATFCIISLVEVYSAGSILVFKDGHFWRTFISQAGFLAFGAVLVWFVHRIPYRFFRLIVLLGYPLALGTLAWALIGGETINGGARWLRIPLLGFTFQPSEMAKGVVVTTVALILTTAQEKDGANKSAFPMILIFSGLVCLLIVTQNFSTAAMLFGVVVLMMIIGRVPWKQLGMLAAVLAFAGTAFYTGLRMLPDDPHAGIYQTKYTQRFITWKNRLTADDMDTSVPPKDFVITDHNRQEVHARIAIARAEGLGVMPGNSIERDFLAQADSDFIYAIIAEETGMIGAGIVLALYILLLIRAGRIANACKRNFPSFLVMGLAMLLVSQAMLNMMVAVGLFPVTGQTLPMISRGGTSTLITCIYFGMILSVSTYAEKERAKAKAAREAEAAAEAAAFLAAADPLETPVAAPAAIAAEGADAAHS